MPDADEIGVESVLEVLTDIYQLEGTIHKGEFRMLCPVHQDTRPSCDVNLKTGVWNCFSCPASGDLIALGNILLGRSRKKVEKLLRPDDPEGISASIQRRVERRKSEAKPIPARKRRKPLEIPERGSYRSGPLTYLLQRGFTKKTLRKFEIEFVKETELPRLNDKPFTIRNAIAIPIVSIDDKTLGWCYRATDDSDPWFRNVRYIYTPDIQNVLARTWFGINHHKDADQVAITEGALDAMWLDQNGIPALAVLGSNVKEPVKIDVLSRYQSVTLFTDRDTAGVLAANSIGGSLRSRGVPARVVRYHSAMRNRRGEPAKDAQDLCPLDVELAFERSIPWTAWKLQHRSLGKQKAS